MLLVARLLEAAAGWFGTIVIARELGPSAFGGYSFVFGLLGIIGLVVDLQVSRVVLRDVLDAGEGAGRVVGSYVIFRTVVGAVAYVAALIVVLAGGYDHEVVIGVVVAGLGFLFVSPTNGISIWFRARRWMRPTAVVLVVAAAFELGLVLAFAAAGHANLVLFAVAVTSGEVVSFLCRIWYARRYKLQVRLCVDTRRWWAWLKESLPLAIGFGLVTVYYKLDIVLLSQLDNFRSVGQYTIGYKFADLAGYIPFALMIPVMTLMVAAWPERIAVVRRHFRQAMVLLTLAASALSIGFALVAPHAVVVLYGDRYAPAIDATRLLVLGAALQFFSYLCFATLASIGRTMPYAVAGAVGLVLNLVLNLALIPPYSFEGSAVATVLTEIGVLIVLLGSLVRTTGIVDVPGAAMLRALLAGGVMVGVYFAALLVVPWWAAAVLGGAAFLGVVHVLGADGPGGLPALLRAARFVEDEDDDARPADAAR